MIILIVRKKKFFLDAKGLFLNNGCIQLSIFYLHICEYIMMSFTQPNYLCTHLIICYTLVLNTKYWHYNDLKVTTLKAHK